ncbi:MAG: hypothetical protein HY046_04245 [Acidobacteria bacterium]|nr:hypothetical protein [Acidobacteriota bacterium]
MAVASVMAAAPANASTLSTSVISLFPRDLEEFAYADLKSARKFKWFQQLKDQMLPARFRQFEQFLASAGADPNVQVEELAWGATLPTAEAGDMIVGVALGQFNPENTATFFKNQKLPSVQVRGFTLYAFGSGAGPSDLYFLYVDANTAAFGHKPVLEKLIEVRFGAQESLLRNERLYPMIEEANGRGLVWAVLGEGYTRMAIQQLAPEVTPFPDAAKLIRKLKASILEVRADRGVDTKFQFVCESPDDANLIADLLDAGLLYKRMQEKQNNPTLAQSLEDARVTAKGDRMEFRLPLSEDALTDLLKRNTFAVKL